MWDVYVHLALRLEYTGDRKAVKESDNVLISRDSKEMQIIADALESGCGYRMAKEIVNAYRIDNGLEPVGYSTVWRAVQQLEPVVSPIKTRKQGSHNENSAWAKARNELATHLLVRLNRLSKEEIEELKDPTTKELPAKYDPKKLKKLVLDQIAFWDETHKKVVIGKTRVDGKMMEVRFKRDPETGKLDADGELEESSSILKVKYPEEVRLCLGVAKRMLEDSNGKYIGMQAEAFDYSAKIILSIRDWDRKVREEIERVRKLTGKKGTIWFDSGREEGEIWEGDPLNKIKGIAASLTKLFEEAGVKNVGDLKRLHDTWCHHVKGCHVSCIKAFRDVAKAAHPGLPPKEKDYTMCANPYLELYGEDSWEYELANSSSMSKYWYIKELVTHVYNESKKQFIGTEHEDDWYFYHNALSLMTAKDTVKWMKEMGYYEHWLLPTEDVNKDTRYANHPVGNSPEFMPMDCHLNKDLDDDVRRHVALTYSLPIEDIRKFSIDTPKNGSSAYLHCWNSISSFPHLERAL